MEPFIVGVDITEVNQLFGRKRQVEILISCAKRKSNAGIIGARRFGKTCILKSMEAYLNTHTEYDAYPLYFDPKTTGISKNTPEVYRTLAALLAAKMCKDNLLSEGEYKIFRRCTLDVSDDMLDMVVQMKEWKSEYQKEALFILAEKIQANNKYVLLLLDEIDYLLQEAFDSPADFSRIRSAATDKKCTLKFWVAGVSSWSSLCTNVGSPELNCGLENVTLSLLKKDDFDSLWSQECCMISDAETRERFLSLQDCIYAKTGGVPYYSKYIGSHMLINKLAELPNYEVIRDYLAEIVNSRFMSDIERSVLYQLAKEDIIINDIKPDGLSGLVSKGLLRIEGNAYSMGIGYLSDYLNARKQDKTLSNTDDIEVKELCSLVDQISILIHNVNVEYKGNKPFKSSDQDHTEFQTLKIICRDEPTMDAFSGSVYKLFYEGSNLGRDLPNGFLTRDFSNMVRALRHLYNHRDCEPTSMSTENLLRLINRGRMPFKQDDYFFMQKSMLKAFHAELLEMLNKKNKSQSKGKINSNFTPKTVFGIFKKGIMGNKDVVEQDFWGNIHEVRSIRNGEIIDDGAPVEYTLNREPNRNLTREWFYFAEDVHLKN